MLIFGVSADVDVDVDADFDMLSSVFGTAVFGFRSLISDDFDVDFCWTCVCWCERKRYVLTCSSMV